MYKSPFLAAIFEASKMLRRVRPSKRNAGKNRLTAAYFRLAKEAVTRLEYLLLYGAPALAEERTAEEQTEDEWFKRIADESPEESRRRLDAREARALAHVERIVEQILQQL